MFQTFDAIGFTFERIRQHRVLVLWVLVGLTVATTLALSLTLYVDAVYSDLLTSRLPDPPFAFRYRYLGAWNGNIDFDDVARADRTAGALYVDSIGLPAERMVNYVRGGTWTMRQNMLNLGALGIGVLTGADDQMRIVAGEWPPTATDDATSDGTIPVLVREELFYSMGLQVGDHLQAQRAGGGSAELVIAALWTPVNADDSAWIFTPRFFEQVFLVQDRATLESLVDGIENPVDEAAWFVHFDGDSVRTTEINALLGAMADANRTVEGSLPGIRLDTSPQEELNVFNDEVNALTAQLFIIIAPVGGLVLYFVSLVAGLLVTRQQDEDVKLRSRGMSRLHVLGIHVLMWLILAGAAVGLAVILSPDLVRLVGRTSSFLKFTDESSVNTVLLTLQPLLIATGTALLAVTSGLFLAWRTTRQSIVGYRQQAARVKQAWWQRAYLDLMLLVPALYVLYTLNQQGLDTEGSAFSDPLVFIGPTVFALALALAFLRVWPWVMGWGARIIGLTANIALLMAFRELTRSIGRYRGALLMMAFTLSLTGFTASMASTLDQSLEDTVNYRVGADMVLITASEAQTEESTDSTGTTSSTVTGYNVPPVNDLYTVDGIAYLSRVGNYAARLTVGTQRLSGTIMGVDRVDMPAIVYFRDDYAQESLAAILNKLASDRTGVIINRQAADAYNIVTNQEVTLGVEALGAWFEQRVRVVGIVDYFPTLNPKTADSQFFLIGNIEPTFELVGTSLPYDVWLSLDGSVEASAVVAAIRETGFPVLRVLDPQEELSAEHAEPARRGVLGFLSVGFVASITLTLIAAIIQSTASFRAQSAQLGALRAMGLGRITMSTYVTVLQLLSASSGIAAGTSIGVLTTLLFLPLLDFSGGLPPYLVRVAWDEIVWVYAAFAGVLLVVTLVTTLVLSRQQMANVVRLGEA